MVCLYYGYTCSNCGTTDESWRFLKSTYRLHYNSFSRKFLLLRYDSLTFFFIFQSSFLSCLLGRYNARNVHNKPEKPHKHVLESAILFQIVFFLMRLGWNRDCGLLFSVEFMWRMPQQILWKYGFRCVLLSSTETLIFWTYGGISVNVVWSRYDSECRFWSGRYFQVV